MNCGAFLEQKPFELFTKWSEEHLELLNQRQQMYKQVTESFLGVVRDSVEMKAPGESLQKALRKHARDVQPAFEDARGQLQTWKEYSSELRKLVAGMPVDADRAMVSPRRSGSTGKLPGRTVREFPPPVSSWMKQSALRAENLLGRQGNRAGRQELPRSNRIVPRSSPSPAGWISLRRAAGW